MMGYRSFAALASASAFFLAPIVALGGENTAKPESVGMSSARLARVQSVLTGAVASKEVGNAVGLVARDGKPVLMTSAGVLPAGLNTIFHVASMTKPVTATAVMMLYEEGKIALSDPVSKYIPEFSTQKVEVADSRGTKQLLDPVRPVTIRDLLTNEAGLAADGDGLDQAWAAKDAQEFARAVAKLPLRAQPGTVYEYGPAYEILGAIIERASGERLDQFFSRRIFVPLKMNDTYFFVPEEKRSRISPLFSNKNGNLAQQIQAETPNQFYSGGGGLRTTASDYYRFAEFLLNGGELDGVRLLSPKTVQLMLADHVGDKYPSASGDYGWGFGVQIRTRVRDADIGTVGTAGWGGGMGTYFWVDPCERLVGIVLTQMGFGDESAPKLEDAFEVALYQSITHSNATVRGCVANTDVNRGQRL